MLPILFWIKIAFTLPSHFRNYFKLLRIFLGYPSHKYQLTNMYYLEKMHAMKAGPLHMLKAYEG